MLATLEKDLFTDLGLSLANPFHALPTLTESRITRKLKNLGSRSVYSSNLYLTHKLINQIVASENGGSSWKQPNQKLVKR